MKKTLVLFAALLFSSALFPCEVKAQGQWPPPGQSMPVEDGPVFNQWMDANGDRWVEVGMDHHGRPVNNSTGYYLWCEDWMQKRQSNGVYTYVYRHGGPLSFQNKSQEDPNFTNYSASHDYIRSNFGAGRYNIGINFYMYNPTTRDKVFLVQVSMGFIVNP